MLVRALVIAALAWVAAITLAPLAIASRRTGLSLAAAGMYAAGARVCHQRPDRCFRIGGAPMAFFLASALSSRRARRIAAVAALPTLLTWGIEVAGLAHPSNTVRAIAALPLGFAAAWLVMTALVPGKRATG